METKQFDELAPNPTNPRILKDSQFKALKASLDRYGDLSGIVFNIQSGQLVGGHQRLNVFRSLGGEKRVVITQRFDQPNRQGTVAVGHVELDGELYAYREVSWNRADELAANAAANHISGEDDRDLLAQNVFELSQLENGDEYLGLMGLDDQDITKLLKSVGVEPDGQEDDPPADDQDESDKLTFALTRDQRLIVERAIEHIKATRDLQAIERASLNGSALFVLASDYLDRHPEPEVNVTSQNTVQPAGDLTDIPNDI